MTEAARAVEAGKSFAVAADLIQTGASGWLEAAGKVKASFSVDDS